MFRGLRHPDNPWVNCGSDRQACMSCDHKCASPAFLRFIWSRLDQNAEHGYHNDPEKPGVTDMACGCPRQAALMARLDYMESPRDLEKREHGSVLHEAYAAANEGPDVFVEQEVSVDGILWGTVDYRDKEVIADHKFRQSRAKNSDWRTAVQLSCYRDMLIANGEDVADLALVESRGPDYLPCEYDPEALQIALQNARAYLRVIRGEAGIESLPPRGRDIKLAFGHRRLCDYCPYEIKKECDEVHPLKDE